MKNYSWNFYNPTKIIFGAGSIAELGSIILDYPHSKNILLVCGRKALRESGYLYKIIKILKDRNISLLNKVEPNPQIGFIDDAVKFARKEKIELVIGLGGGSVIDTAKVVAILADKKYSLPEVLYKNIQIKEKGLPCFAIPTTAGTGSEVTKVSAIWDRTKQVKLTMCNDAMFPEVAIVDPTLTVSLGSYQTAVTGLDALCHAIESYWSKKATPISQDFSLKAVRLIFKYLRKSFKEPGNIKAREGMSLASLYAGLAISNTGTTVSHSISYILTLRYGIPHGLACAVSLPHLIRYNAKTADESLNNLALNTGSKNINQLAGKVEKLLKEMKLPTKLREYGIIDNDLELIKRKSFFTSNVRNNFIRLTQKDLKFMLKKML